MRLSERRVLIGLFIAGVAGAILIMPAIYFLGLWLAPPRPIPAASHVTPVLADALWARADGGRATELQPINPISFVRMRVCRTMAAQTDDLALRGARRAECMKLLPAIQAADYLSGVHVRDANAATGGFREAISQFATAAWVTRSWTKAELLDTLAERGDFGFAWRGVDAAARGYFGRGAASLSLPEAALVAAFIGDRQVDPWCDPDAAIGMRRRLLERMLENGAIDQATFETASQSERFDPPTFRSQGVHGMRLSARQRSIIVTLRAQAWWAPFSSCRRSIFCVCGCHRRGPKVFAEAVWAHINTRSHKSPLARGSLATGRRRSSSKALPRARSLAWNGAALKLRLSAISAGSSQSCRCRRQRCWPPSSARLARAVLGMASSWVDPWCDPERVARMRRRVLEKMRTNLVIDDVALEQADRTELGLTTSPPNHKPCEG